MPSLWLTAAAVAWGVFRIIVVVGLINRLRSPRKSDVALGRAVVGFFHPFCNDAGGGERVLWQMIVAVQNAYKDVHCVVYTGDIDVSGDDILQRAQDRFNFVLPRPVEFIFLKRRPWVEAKYYNRLTIIRQCLGSIVLGVEALMKCRAHVVIDTMGYAFTYPVFRYLGGCVVGCYVHYPIVSTDMLEDVQSGRIATGSAWKRRLKLLYFKFIALLYGWCGRRATDPMANSSWTAGHVRALWWAKDTENVHIVYPPCDTQAMSVFPLDRNGTTPTALSIAQFRPEKNQRLQLDAFALVLKAIDAARAQQDTDDPELAACHSRLAKGPAPVLTIIGSLRDSNADDSALLADLQAHAKELGIQDSVKFLPNASYSALLAEMRTASVGLHTMRQEHFGIGVVDMMAAGLIVVAHNSAGPAMDIVKGLHGEQVGYLATTAEEYAACMAKSLGRDKTSALSMRAAARDSSERFSEAVFHDASLTVLHRVFQKGNIDESSKGE